MADYDTFAQLEAACEAASLRFNTRVHRETNERPVDRLEHERESLHPVPAHPYSVALGQTRVVSWSSLISFEGARYSVPQQFCEEIVYVRRGGDEVVITALAQNGPYEAARHAASTRGQITLVDAHYPDRPRSVQRTPKANNKCEAEFLAIGEGAQRYLSEMAAVGALNIERRLAEALELIKSVERGLLDEVLGLCALEGRFAAGDLTSVLSARGPRLRRIGEGHSLQPGTGGWAGLGDVR